MPSTYRATLEYDGAAFCGWQSQAAGPPSVQGTLTAALARITGTGSGPGARDRCAAVSVVGAGRTDAGVHAEGQVASFWLEADLDPAVLSRALNGTLPRSIAVVRLERVAPDFHARRDALAKLYRYRILNRPERSPLRHGRCLLVTRPLDCEAMSEAAAACEGTHDFASFQAAGSSVTTSVRTLLRCSLVPRAGGELHFEVAGTGFLRHMVRNLVGTWLEVGRGRREAASLPALLAARDRRRAGPTAPAHGLCLVRVRYPGDPPLD